VARGEAPAYLSALGAALAWPGALVASAELEPSELQDLSEALPDLLDVKARARIPLRFRVQIELGNGTESPPQEAVAEINKVLAQIKDAFQLE
jgi:hypothetical protein